MSRIEATESDTLMQTTEQSPCEPGAAEMVTAPYVPPIGQEERLERLAGLGYTEGSYDASGDRVRVGQAYLSTDAADRLIRFCEASGRRSDFPPARDIANLAGSGEVGDERTAEDVFQEWAHRCSAEQ